MLFVASTTVTQTLTYKKVLDFLPKNCDEISKNTFIDDVVVVVIFVVICVVDVDSVVDVVELVVVVVVEPSDLQLLNEGFVGPATLSQSSNGSLENS